MDEPVYDIFDVSLVWGENFPKGYGHTSLAYLRRCAGFECAKNGDFFAAHSVVEQCVKADRISTLIENHPNSILVPVLGRNALPLALAQKIGLPIWENIHLLSTAPRKNMLAIQRLLHKPIFIGDVQKDKEYIIVDDIITQGGTVAALRDYILEKGGKVVAVVALAFAVGSHKIAPTNDIVYYLFFKFGYSICLLQMIGIVNSFEELTYSQIRYLLKFSSVHNVHRKMEQRGLITDVPKVKKVKRFQNPFRMMLNEKSEAAFSGELTYFPQLEKRRVHKNTTPVILTDEQKEILGKWKSLTKDEQKQIMLQMNRREQGRLCFHGKQGFTNHGDDAIII